MEDRAIPATEFKATCLALVEEVRRRRVAFTITKRGKPVARLVPLARAATRPLFGALRGTVKIQGDIVAPLDVEWNAMK